MTITPEFVSGGSRGRGQDGPRAGTTTYHHRFCDLTQARFVDAIYLRVGDLLRTPTGTAAILAISTYHTTQTTYDLTIGGIHAYYVEAGNAPGLVHNDGNGRLDPINLGDGYTGRLDKFPMGQGADFEIHVYYGDQEVGVFGRNGWFDKHGRSVDVRVPSGVYNRLKGQAVDFMRRTGRIGPLGTQDVGGDSWKKPRLTGGGC